MEIISHVFVQCVQLTSCSNKQIQKSGCFKCEKELLKYESYYIVSDIYLISVPFHISKSFEDTSNAFSPEPSNSILKGKHS